MIVFHQTGPLVFMQLPLAFSPLIIPPIPPSSNCGTGCQPFSVKFKTAHHLRPGVRDYAHTPLL
jgi:hypothetical protein